MTPFQVPEGPYNIDGVMESIRTQIVEPAHAQSEAPPEPPAPRVLDGSAISSLRASTEEMARVAQLDVPYRIRSHRRLLGFFIDPVKRLIHWASRPYADLIREKQSSLNLSLVAALTAIAKELDRLDAGVNRLDQASSRHEADLKTLLARHDIGPLMNSIPARTRLDGLNRTRGTVEDIAGRQFHYVDLFDGAPGQVLDIGCGRGELLTKLRERGVECFGAEVDPLMVEAARAAGVTVHQMDGLEALRRAQDGKLGGIFAGQVVEHL
ncbi:class I SAM-dependent methyltransferase, partial [bacterium]|nr:class I SAM-dependent methyltransferase [bacterium]